MKKSFFFPPFQASRTARKTLLFLYKSIRAMKANEPRIPPLRRLNISPLLLGDARPPATFPLGSPLPQPDPSQVPALPLGIPVFTSTPPPLSPSPLFLDSGGSGGAVLSVVQSQNHALNCQLQGAHNEIGRLQFLLQSQSNQHQNLKTESGALHRQLQEARDELSRLQCLLKARGNQNQELKSRVLRLEEQLRRAKEREEGVAGSRPTPRVTKTPDPPAASPTPSYACVQDAVEGKAHHAHGEVQPPKRTCPGKYKRTKGNKEPPHTPPGSPPVRSPNRPTRKLPCTETGNVGLTSPLLGKGAVLDPGGSANTQNAPLPTARTKRRRQPARNCKKNLSGKVT